MQGKAFSDIMAYSRKFGAGIIFGGFNQEAIFWQSAQASAKTKFAYDITSRIYHAYNTRVQLAAGNV